MLHRKRFICYLLVAVFLSGVISPAPLLAQPQPAAQTGEGQPAREVKSSRRRIRNPLHRFARGVARGGKKLARGIGRVLKRGRQATRFVVTLPKQIARKLGLGATAVPIIELMLVRKLPGIFGTARKGEVIAKEYDRVRADYKAQRKKVEVFKQTLRDMAKELNQRADRLDRVKDAMKQQLLRDPKFLKQYMVLSVDVARLAQQHRDEARRCEEEARKMTPQRLVNIMVGKPLKQLLQRAPRILGAEFGRQMLKGVDPKVITGIVESDPMTPDKLIDLIVGGEVDKLLSLKRLGDQFDLDELKAKVKEQFMKELKEKRQELRKKWRERIGEILKEQLDELEKRLGELDKGTERLKQKVLEEEKPFDLKEVALKGPITSGDEQKRSVGQITLTIHENGKLEGSFSLKDVHEPKDPQDALDALAAGGAEIQCKKFSGATTGLSKAEKWYSFEAQAECQVTNYGLYGKEGTTKQTIAIKGKLFEDFSASGSVGAYGFSAK
jgi:hypothetical protein